MARLLIAGVACAVVTGCSRPGIEYPRSGAAALKFEVRRGSMVDVPGWQVPPSQWWWSPENDPPLKCVSPQAELSNDDLAGTSVRTDDMGNSQIVIRLTEAATSRFAKLSADLANPAGDLRHLVFVVDGKVLAAPTVTAPIRDGVIVLSVPLDEPEARRIAAGIVGPQSE